VVDVTAPDTTELAATVAVVAVDASFAAVG
jgi:hypothetical protein